MCLKFNIFVLKNPQRLLLGAFVGYVRQAICLSEV